jgi:hypothetical protein
MTGALWIARLVVTALIAVLTFAGFIPREAANRLVPLQKFLTNELERRS